MSKALPPDYWTLPRFSFDTDLLPEAERFPAWCATTAPFVEPFLAPGVGPADFHYRSDFAILGQSHLGHSQHTGVAGYRFNGARPQVEAPELFFLQTYVRGGFTGRNGDQLLQVVAGDVVLIDSLQPMEIQVPHEVELLSLVIPRQAVLAAVGGRALPMPCVLPAAGIPATVLRQTLLALWQQLAELGAEQVLVAEAMLIGALAAMLREENVQTDGDKKVALEKATHVAMRAHVEQILHEPGLDAAALCRHFHCSRATVYRMFAPEGVAAFIRRRRLERCHADLAAARPGDTVSAIALRWGFVSEQHFSRLFRAAYGKPPSEVLARGRSAA